MNISEYLEYWDDNILQWAKAKNGKVTEPIWNVDRMKLHECLMPEPYWGNPDDCSVVVLNLNPGACQNPTDDDPSHWSSVQHNANGKVVNGAKGTPNLTISGLMAGKYSAIALDFPLLDENPYEPIRSYPGTRWWKRRMKWIERMVGKSDKRPFAVELCGWHSQKWSNAYLTSAQMAAVRNVIEPMLSDAITKSESEVGLAIGKIFATNILPQLGYKDITADILKQTLEADNSWQPNQKVNRWFKVFRNDAGATIVCTWSIGGNNPPGEEFVEYEKQIMSKIKPQNH